MGLNFFKLKKSKFVEESKNVLYSSLDDSASEWDPAGKSPIVREIKKANVDIHSKYLFLKNNPRHVLKSLLLVIGIYCLIFILFELIAIYSNFNFVFLKFILFIIFFIIMAYFITYINSLKRDIVKLEVAEKNNFLYWPTPNRDLWRNYNRLYPELFSKGDTNQNFEDVFWGCVNIDNEKRCFVAGVFNYTTITHDSKGRRREHKHKDHFFVIKLPRKINARFMLFPEGFKSAIFKFFNKKEIHTSSVEFNKTFAFGYKGKKTDKELNITQILTPRVQEELLKLYNYKRSKLSFFQKRFSNVLSVLFTNSEVVFYSSGSLLKNVKSGFFTYVNIAEQDKKFLKNEIDTMVNISNDMIKYL